MESESENISTSTNVAHPKSRINLIVVIAVIATSIVIGAFLVSAFISVSPEGQDAWLFKGAYATYKGSMASEDMNIDMLGMPMSYDFTVDFTVQLKVVDFNSTHALISTSTSIQMSSSFGATEGETVEDKNNAWVPLSEMDFMAGVEDVDLTKSYESTVDIPGFGTRTCMVYDYVISNEGMTMTVYIDKAIGWPLKMSVSMDENELSLDLELDINLIETNIPALK